MRSFSTPLPIDDALPALIAALGERSAAVLVAPPGAGKTTRVPLALLDEPWLQNKKIILLEPRRLAARGAAARMAQTLGEKVGDTVGLRVRLGSQISARTRIEVVTEGVFTRMIVDDPELSGVGCVLFDEFHERSLDADSGLAFALDAQGALRPDLRILVMSATIDGARVASLLDDAPLIQSEGRSFPVETRHVSRDPTKRIEDQTTEIALRALRGDQGSMLIFLPGQGPIERVAERLRDRVDDNVIVAPLYGAMEQRAQDEAVRPAPAGRRKIVLATSIAETSLTIEGVRIVIDSGLARVPRYEPDIGITRLETVRVSRAAADQRRGRAGRIEPGVCYRLWDEAATGALEPFARPEILDADLSGLLLDCGAWGVSDPTQLKFLDSPPAPALAEARALLAKLEAIDKDGRLTDIGQRVRALPLPPRLARMIIDAADHDAANRAAEIAALIVERGLGGDSPDLADRLDRFRRDRGARATAMRRMAENWARLAARGATRSPRDMSDAALLSLAYPDRIAKARGKRGDFVMANGRGAAMAETERLARAPFLVIAEIAGGAASARILLAAELDPADIDAVAEGRIAETDVISFDANARALRARRARKLDAITLDEKPEPVPATIESARALARGAAMIGVARLNWSKAQRQICDRVNYLRRALFSAGERAKAEIWPDLSDAALAATAEEWLAPFIIGRARLEDIGADDLQAALDALLPYAQRRDLDQQLPSHFQAPTGSNIPIDYGAEEGPVLALRVQELFGLDRHPSVANGAIPLVLHLLSPAQRPIQITRDLPGFWRGSWAAVRADLRGRYPRHPWPDNPLEAAPTTRAKPRGS